MLPKLLISPDLNRRIEKVEELLKHLKVKNPSPDLLYFEDLEKLGIKEAKEILEHLSLKPFEAESRVVVIISAQNLTIDAQNALLKTLEEPSKSAILILGTSSESEMIPTIISRCQVIYLESKMQEETNFEEEIEQLVGWDLEERFKFIENLEAKEKFLQALVGFFSRKLKKNPQFLEFSKELIRAEKWANSNGNLRAILEYLMLVMPN